MRRVLAALNGFYIAMVLITTTCLVILILMQIVARYIFNSPFSWTEEITLFAFCWLTFSGSAVASYEGNHLEVDYFFNRLPLKRKKLLQMFIYVVSIGLGLFIMGDAAMTMGRQQGISSVAARLPIGLYTLAIVVGFVGISVFCTMHLIKLVTKARPVGTSAKKA